MVKGVHRRASNLPFEKDQPGCMWGVFQLLGLHQRAHGRQPPSEGRQVGEGKDAAGSKYLKLRKRIPLNPYSESSKTLVEKRDNYTGKVHNQTSHGAQNTKKSPYLTRTMSIHHLECNDYVEVASAADKEPSSENESAYVPQVHKIMDEVYNSNSQEPEVSVYLPDNYTQECKSYVAQSVLTRSGSYPGTKSFRRNRSSRIEESSKNTGNHTELQSASYRLSTEKDNSFALSQLKDTKERLRDIAKDKKVSQFLTMDGILDKVPYGHKVPHDSGSQVSSFNRHPWRSKSGREWAALSEKRHVIPQFSRSRSLSDSLDKYSALMEFDSNTKIQKKHDSLIKRNLPSRTCERTHSLPEFLADFPKNDNSVTGVQDAFSWKDAEIDLNESFPATVSDQSHSISKHKMELESSGDIYDDIKTEAVIDDSLESQDSRTCSSYGDDIETNTVIGSEVGKLSPQSVLNTKIEEDDVEGQSDPTFNGIVQKSAEAAVIDGITSGLDKLQARVDNKDRDDFGYVVNVLKQSGFYGSKKHHSPELPLSPTIFKELEGLGPDTEICTLDADIDLNHLLLFDLVDEVLSEMYGNSTSPFHCPPSSNLRIKSSATGHQCLTEVWLKISRHLSSPSPSLNHLFSQVLDKKDDWFRQRSETQCVGMELEEMVLDDLLDEVVLGWLDVLGNW